MDQSKEDIENARYQNTLQLVIDVDRLKHENWQIKEEIIELREHVIELEHFLAAVFPDKIRFKERPVGET
jgi:hypothetical protein